MIKQRALFIISISFILGCTQSKSSNELVHTSNKNNIKEDTADWHPATINYTINTDSIEVHQTAKFSLNEKKEDEVIFTLKVTNRGNHIIPTIQTARAHNLQILINGKNAMLMTLSNFASSGDQSLAKDASDFWNFPVIVEVGTDTPVDFSKKFTFQWIYYGIESEIIEVDAQNKKIRNVNRHVKSDLE